MNTRPETLRARTAHFALATCLAMSCAITGAAQDLTHKAPPQTKPIALIGGSIHTVDGPVIAAGTVWFEDGVIRGIGTDPAAAAVPPTAERIDVGGLHVYPGLISAFTKVGLEEIGSVRATADHDEVGDMTPEVRAAVAVNPDSTVIPVTRSNGVLTVGVVPSGGLIPGRASVMELAGWTWEDMSLLPECAVLLQWPAMPRRGGDEQDEAEKRATEQRQSIDEAFALAAAYAARRDTQPSEPTDTRHEALVPALRGEQPVWIRADGLEQIQSAISWAAGRGLEVVLIGGRDAPLCVDLLAEHAVKVIVTGTHRLPSRRDEAFDAPFRLPQKLEEAGLEWCLTTGGSFYNERNLPYHAATAVAYGLPRDTALRSITLAAAECLGVADQLGSITVGKRATLFVTDGDPLEITTSTRIAFVSGRRIDLSNKQTELAEKYRAKYRQLEKAGEGR